MDRDLADRLLADLAALRMETFLDPPIPPEAEHALAAPAGAFDVTIAGEPAPLRIEVGGETAAGKRVWRAGGQVFESASALAAAVARPASEWRSRNWTRFENWRIEKARIEEPAGAFELARSEASGCGTARRSRSRRRATCWRRDRGEGGAPRRRCRAGHCGAPPRLAVTLSDADGNEERLTLLAAADPAAAEVPARTSGREVTLLLPRSLVEELEKKVDAARLAEPVGEPPPHRTGGAQGLASALAAEESERWKHCSVLA